MLLNLFNISLKLVCKIEGTQTAVVFEVVDAVAVIAKLGGFADNIIVGIGETVAFENCHTEGILKSIVKMVVDKVVVAFFDGIACVLGEVSKVSKHKVGVNREKQ